VLRSAVFSRDNIALNDSNGRVLRRHVTDDFHERILREMVDCFILRTSVLDTVRNAKSITETKLFGLLRDYITCILPLNVPVWISGSKLLLTTELYFNFDVGFIYLDELGCERSTRNLYKDLYYAHNFSLRRNKFLSPLERKVSDARKRAYRDTYRKLVAEERRNFDRLDDLSISSDNHGDVVDKNSGRQRSRLSSSCSRDHRPSRYSPPTSSNPRRSSRRGSPE